MTAASEFATRFAPSPTGRLHLGHAYSALLAFRRAERKGGRFILRIEDIDRGRSRPEFDAGILEDLAWLGLEWEEPVRRQSAHMADYRAALDRLEADGLLYPCFCTRREIAQEIAASGNAPHGPDGPRYPGICRRLSADERAARLASGAAYALRLDMARSVAAVGTSLTNWRDEHAGDIRADPESFGDVVLARKETPTSYHLAVTVDDALQGITHVIRGEDLFHATHIHVLLQALLGLPMPVYHHHALIYDEAGRRFAKRDKAATLAACREAGMAPAEVVAKLGL